MELYFLEGHTYRLFTHTELDPNTRLYHAYSRSAFYDDLFFGVRTNDIAIRVFYRKF